MISLKDRRLFVLLGALLSLKLALAVVDGYPSVFMGDSSAYLSTAIHGYIPHDRSILYGWLLRPLAVWPHSLSFLVYAQTILSGVAAWLLAVNLTSLGASFRWAAAADVICAIEPLQLISERYVLADTTALFLFAVLVTFVIWCWRTGSGFAMALAFVTGVILIAIRISYLPLVMANSLLLPFLWMWKRGPDREGDRLAAWLARDEGGLRPQDAAFGQEMRKVFGIDPGPHGVNGPVWRWQRLAIPWYWLLVVLPLVLPAFLHAVARPIRPVVAYLDFFLLVIFLPAVVITQHAEPRYLIPVAWLTFLAAAPLFISRTESGDREVAPALPGCKDKYDRTPTGCSS